jgi:hypothetical protein
VSAISLDSVSVKVQPESNRTQSVRAFNQENSHVEGWRRLSKGVSRHPKDLFLQGTAMPGDALIVISRLPDTFPSRIPN